MAEINGTEQQDLLSGTGEADVIRGLGGNDEIKGGGGDDELYGGDGFDRLNGELGSDKLYGGNGHDELIDDLGGDDQLYGGDDDSSDDLYLYRYGQNFSTVLLDGGGGNDRLRLTGIVGYADVTMRGGSGDDSLFADGGRNIIIDAGTGADTVEIHLRNTAFQITLGTGSDTLTLTAPQSTVQVVGSIVFTDFAAGDGGDRLLLSDFIANTLQNWDQKASPFATGHLRLVQSGSSTLLQIDRDGSAGTTFGYYTLFTFQYTASAALTELNLGGYASNGTINPGQQIVGTHADDRLTGTSGADVIRGLEGNNVLRGGGGNDQIYGGGGYDDLDGEFGDDKLYGGAGYDYLHDSYGGNDEFYGGDDDSPDQIYVTRDIPSAPASIVLLDGGAGRDSLYFLSRRFVDTATLRGGLGDDTIAVSGGQTVTIDAGAGVDRVSVDYIGTTYTVSLGDDADLLTIDSTRGFQTAGSVVVTDFLAGDAGDQLLLGTYLSKFLQGWSQNSNPFATGHLRLVQNGSSTLLQVDRDGTGGAFGYFTLVSLQNTNAATLTAANLSGYSSDGSSGVGQTITGTANRDVLSGRGGPDVINGLGGDDDLQGGGGDDELRGGDGVDRLDGELGDDKLYGGNDGDTLLDSLGGNDQLSGGDDDGADFLSVSRQIGNAAATSVLLDGGGGPDQLFYFTNSYIDSAVLRGGGGDDSISSQGGLAITIEAGAGADRVGVDQRGTSYTISLGEGSDTLTLVPPSIYVGLGSITVSDFEVGDAGDELVLDPYLAGVLLGWNESSNPFGTGHLRLVRENRSVLLQMDRDGAGGETGYVTLITLQDVDLFRLTAQNLGGYAATVSGSAGVDIFTGATGNDMFSGGAGADVFHLEQGGDDFVDGGVGEDGIYFGAALTSADHVDGGEGALDQIGLQGQYIGLTLGAKNLVGIEQLVLLPGNDTRFGDTSGALYSYDLSTVDANIAAGQQLIVTANTLRAGENLTFNGTAETDGFFLTYGGLGTDILTGGQKDDGFFFGTGGRFGASDTVDGQGGSADQLGLQGVYTGANAITFGAGQLKGIEFIVVLSGGDARFGSTGAGYSYDLTMNDGNVAAGAMMVVSANTLRAGETLTFNGSAETDGRFSVFSGAGADLITGGRGNDEISGLGGNDRITGGLGADRLTGGGGADTFVYAGAAESTSLGFDSLIGFDYRADRIDLPGDLGGVTGIIGAGALRSDSFDADLAAAVDGALHANSAVIFRPTAGSFAGREFMIVDANGDGSYAAGSDFVFEIVAPSVPIEPSSDFFI